MGMLCLMSSCENDIHEVQNLGKHSLGVETGTNVMAYLSETGIMKARLKAPLMLSYDKDSSRIVMPNGLNVDFFDSLAHVDTRVFAKYGDYNQDKSLVHLKDHVVILDRKHDTLWCKDLYWDQNKKIFFTDFPIRLSQQSPLQRIYGKGMVCDQNFKWFSIKKIGKVYNGINSYFVITDTL